MDRIACVLLFVNVYLVFIDNPCPQLGSIVTIKLSEHEDSVRANGTLLPCSVETHFQMNYNTGEWKVIQKPPKMTDRMAQVNAVASLLP